MAERRKKASAHRPKTAAAKKKSVAKKAPKKAAASKPAKPAEAKELNKSTIPVYDQAGKSVDTLTLDPIFHSGEINTDVIHATVVMIQAGDREGTASSKDRGAVSGGGKKPWKQKGTGRARHASIRSPLWRGGGVTFGPKPRDYSYSLPRAVRRKGVAETVKTMASRGKLFVVKDLNLSQPKTKMVVKILAALKLEKPLLVVEKLSENLVLASRNIPGVGLRTAADVNALDVASHRECVMTQGAYTGLLKRLKS